MKGLGFMNIRKLLCAVSAFTITASAFAGCGSSDSSGSSGSEDSVSITFSETDDSSAEDEPVTIYLDEYDQPYYYDSEGNQVYLTTEEEEYSYEPIYGEYSEDGVSFTIPDGWYADTSYGYPIIIEDGDDAMYSYACIIDSSWLVDADFEDITSDNFVEMFDSYVEGGYYSSYTIDESDISSLSVYDAKGYVITTVYEGDEDEEDETYYTEYIFIDSDPAYTLMIETLNDEDSIAAMQEMAYALGDTIIIDSSETAEEETEDE